jgi:putative DNA primase/helicase
MAPENSPSYADLGLPVFPLKRGTKEPLTANGFKDASTDPERIARWRERWPDAGVAVPTGPVSGWLVLDVDADHGGFDSLAVLEAQNGKLPATRTHRTGGGGLHLIFRYPDDGHAYRNSVDKLGPGLDVRGLHGYIAVPPTLHASGNRYAVEDDREPVDAPEWLLNLLRDRQTGFDTATALDGFAQGRRDSGIFALAGKLRNADVPYDEAKELVLKAATNSTPPFSEHEALAKLDGAYGRYAPGEERPGNTDLGNARRLVRLYGRDLRYVADMGRWYFYNGQRWQPDVTGTVYRYAKDAVKTIYAEAQQVDDDAQRKALVRHALKSESQHGIEAMVKLARYEDGIAITADQLDTDPWLLNVQNGTVDLRTGQLKPHNRNDLISKLAPVDFDPSAESPAWEAFQYQISGGDADLIRFKQRAYGYALTGDVSEQKLFVLHGDGANGKSTEANAVGGVMGDYFMQAPSDLLLQKYGGGASPEVAALKGARLVVSAETDEGRHMAESRVKSLTGGDRITARFLYQGHFSFDPTHKLFLVTNHKPEVRGGDTGIWRRILLVPYDVQIPEDQQDKRLPEKLRAEAPGVLNWLIAGCLGWQRDGLGVPPAVEAATAEYRQSMDPLQGFFDDCVTFGSDQWEENGELWDCYLGWAHQNGQQPLTRNAFAERLRAKGCEAARQYVGGKQKRVWQGVALVHTRVQLEAA